MTNENGRTARRRGATLGTARSAKTARAGGPNGMGLRATTRRRAATACAVATLAGCRGGPLAEADGRRLSVEDAARIVAEHSTLPADSQVARAVAELWVDYTLLATHLAADSSLATLDVAPLLRQPLEEEMLARLQEEVIEADTVVSDEELAAQFAAEMPGARATASQILLMFPPEATGRQRDSVQALARAVHARLDAGADFAELAMQTSNDPGSARRGGALGTFERGRMLASVDRAVFAMRPGETSEPVASSIGYHVLRLDALEAPELPEVAAELRVRIRRERQAEAEAAYIAHLDSLAELRLAGDALAVVRALANTRTSRLGSRAGERPVLEWEGGSYTAGDFVALARESPLGFFEGVDTSGDEELEEALLRVGRQRLLVEEARARGFEPDQSRRDSVAAQLRQAIREQARTIGLGAGGDAESGASQNAEPAAGRGDAHVQAADADGNAGPDQVRAALAAVLSGRREISPLGAVALLLREQSSWRIRLSLLEATAQRARDLQSR